MTPKLFYREIPLTQGKVALVDEHDYEWLMQWKWFAHWNRNTRSFYAGRSQRSLGTISMHREVLGLRKGDERNGDHINHDTLNNRRSNLRITTRSQNTRNRRSGQSNNTSGFKGVSYIKSAAKWRAAIGVQGKKIHLGYRDTPEECAVLYAEGVKKYFGEYACDI